MLLGRYLVRLHFGLGPEKGDRVPSKTTGPRPPYLPLSHQGRRHHLSSPLRSRRHESLSLTIRPSDHGPSGSRSHSVYNSTYGPSEVVFLRSCRPV